MTKGANEMLSDEQINNIAFNSTEGVMQFARAIEAAVLEELAKQEPVAWAYEGDSHFDGKKWSSELEVTTSYQVAKFKAGTIEKPLPLFFAPVVWCDRIKKHSRK